MKGLFFAAHLAGSATLLFGAGAAAATPPTTPPATTAPVSTAPLQRQPAANHGALSSSLTSVPTYRRYVHPGARAMAGIDWARITASPLGKQLAAQINAMGIDKMAAVEGMDFLSAIEKLVISSPGEAGAAEGSPARLSEDAPFVVAMQGRFKIEALRKSLLGRKATRVVHRDAEVWMPAKSDTALAIVNSQLMLIGDRKSLRATLDAQSEQEGPAENRVVQRAHELAGQYDLWMVSELSPEGLAGQQQAQPVQAEMLKGLDQFEFGVSLRQGLKADVSLLGRTPEDTSKLGTMLAGMKALAAMSLRQQANRDPDLPAMLDKLEIGTAEGRVMLSVAYSQKELDRGIESLLANRRAGGGATRKGATKAQAPPQPRRPEVEATTTIEAAVDAPVLAPPAPPKPLMVRIYNADGGTREFKLNP